MVQNIFLEKMDHKTTLYFSHLLSILYCSQTTQLGQGNLKDCHMKVLDLLATSDNSLNPN